MKKIYITIVSLLFLPLYLYAQQTIDAQLQKLLIAESAIENLYVDKIDNAELVESAIRGMLEELDPPSTYLTAEEVNKSHESL